MTASVQFTHLSCGIFGAVLSLMAFDSANAAEVSSQTLDNGVEVIEISGDIKSGDENRFRELTLKFPKAIVALDSLGGSLRPALEMGKLIRLRGYSTLVLQGSVCASACAHMWLAGQTRYLEQGSKLGFHASYKEVDGRLIESGMANAVVGHYLSQLNLSERTAMFVSAAPPDKILWLTEENRELSGIEYSNFKRSSLVFSSSKYPVSKIVSDKDLQPAIIPIRPPEARTIPALTVVTLRIDATLGSKLSVSGQTFPITLAEPITIDGQQLIPAGVTGMGEVVHAKKTGVGVGGELVLAARYLDFNGQQIKLRSMQVGGKGKDNQALTFAVGATVGLPALFIRGKHIEVPEGSLATAKIAAQVVLPQPQAAVAPAAPEQKDNPTGGNANGS